MQAKLELYYAENKDFSKQKLFIAMLNSCKVNKQQCLRQVCFNLPP